MFDNNLPLQASATKTASFASSSVDLLTRPSTPRRGLKAKVSFSAASCGSTAGSITGATNASPIVVAETSHGYATGDVVTITGVTGNTAANGTWVVTVVDSGHFSLNGSTGNAAYVSGGSSYVWARAVFNVDQSPDNSNWFPVAYQIQISKGFGESGATIGPSSGSGTGYYTESGIYGTSTVLAVQGVVLPPTAATAITAVGGEVDIPFEAFFRYVRLNMTLSGTGASNSPTITYRGDLTVGWP